MNEKNSYFITLEGLDGSGTTTQIQRLKCWLESMGRPVHITCEPTRLPIGLLIKEVLRGQHGPVPERAIALMFAGDRIDHIAQEIEPNMEIGRDVISDRYVMSSFAYQGRGHDLEWVKEINKYALVPDLTIFLSVPVDECIRRIKARKGPGEYYEKRHLLEQIDKAYRRHLNGEEAACGTVVTVDGTASEDTVETAIVNQVKKHLNIA